METTNVTYTKKEKIESLAKAMTRSKRADETEFTHFTDEAPEELKSLYLEHYEVRDIDYEIFSNACDIMSEIYSEEHKVSGETLNDLIANNIYERASDSASYYTAERLSYLNVWNQDEISGELKEGATDIGEACAIWYDGQVEQACFIIKEWIESND